MERVKQGWHARKADDLKLAMREVQEILETLAENASLTVVGVRVGNVNVEARWDHMDTHLLEIEIAFPGWPVIDQQNKNNPKEE